MLRLPFVLALLLSSFLLSSSFRAVAISNYPPKRFATCFHLYCIYIHVRTHEVTPMPTSSISNQVSSSFLSLLALTQAVKGISVR